MPILFLNKAASIRFAGSCVALGMSQSPKTYSHTDLAADEFIKEA